MEDQTKEQRIELLRERRRALAAEIRSLLQQIERLEYEFESANRELLQATGRNQAPPAA